MSAVGDAFKAIREVVLLSSRVDGLEKRITSLGADVDGLADLIGSLRDRVSRLEGFVEGATAASSRRRLPKE